MREMINRIQNILDQMKGFTVGTSTKSEDKMIIDYKGKRYVVTLEEIENPNEDVFKDLDFYLK